VEHKKTAASKCKEEEVIMRRGGVGKRKACQMLNGEWEFPGGGRAELAEAALECLSDDGPFASCPDVGEEMLQLAANAGEIGGNRAGLDMMGHVDDEIAQGFLCGLIREVVELTKGEVRLEVGMVSRSCRTIERKPKGAGA
jgi:hypothetical protein